MREKEKQQEHGEECKERDTETPDKARTRRALQKRERSTNKNERASRRGIQAPRAGGPLLISQRQVAGALVYSPRPARAAQRRAAL